MSYCFTTTLNTSFEDAIHKTIAELKEQGFGVLTEIDVKDTLKNKLDVEFRNYVILGACNPPFAYRALQAESRIGAMLPCNVVVQETTAGQVEISAVDPLASMQAVQNPELARIAQEVQAKLKTVIANLP